MKSKNKLLAYLAGVVVVAFVSVSCGSSKNIAYLQDAEAGELAQIDQYTNVIKSGDLLSITVSSSKPELAVPFNLYSVKSQMSVVNDITATQSLEGYTVNMDGNIDFPTLGTIHVAGLTRSELSEILKGMLASYMPDPIVTINFLNFNITVIGEVERPGTFKVVGDRISILEALGMAGDMTEYGDRENVIVIREIDGVREIGRLNIKSKDIFNSPFYYLQQNDVVCVDPIDARARSTSVFQMNLPAIASLGTFASSVAMLIFYITSVLK